MLAAEKANEVAGTELKLTVSVTHTPPNPSKVSLADALAKARKPFSYSTPFPAYPGGCIWDQILLPNTACHAGLVSLNGGAKSPLIVTLEALKWRLIA